MIYPKELYHASGHYRVTFSEDEHEMLKAKNYTDNPEEGRKYIPFSAIGVVAPKPKPAVPPTLEAVLAAGYSEEAATAIVAEEARKCAAGEYPYPHTEEPSKRGPGRPRSSPTAA